jgi:transcriptional regulator with XRE-family HTH domain
LKYPNVEAERARAGWTQEQLAEKLGVTRKTLYNWELSGIPDDKLDLMARLFKVSPEYLLMREEVSNDGDV